MELQEIKRKLSNNVFSEWKLFLKYTSIVNSNGGGYSDVLWCPASVTMSGTVNRTVTTPTISYLSGSILCLGSHMGNPYTIYFLSGSISDTIADYLSDALNVSSWIWDRSFLDGDSTLMDYSAALPTSWDNIDDNFDSDNYIISSTWSTLYPSSYQDDDNNARKLLYGYANPWSWFANIFWNNSEIIDYIDGNINNIDTLNEKIRCYDKFLNCYSWY